MHRIIRSVRRILPAELPTVRDMETGTERPMNPAELLNADIVCINEAEHLYSCQDQDVRDDRMKWDRIGVPSPGEALSEGSIRERHDDLPDSVRHHVLRAVVYRSTDPGKPDLAIAQQAVLARAGIALDSQNDVLLQRARRKAAKPGVLVEARTVPMSEKGAGDVVEAEGLYAHSWAGESRR